MPHNESLAERQEQQEPRISKLKKVKSNLPWIAAYGGIIGMVAVPTVLSVKIQLLQYQTAKLALEAAKAAANK